MSNEIEFNVPTGNETVETCSRNSNDAQEHGVLTKYFVDSRQFVISDD